MPEIKSLTIQGNSYTFNDSTARSTAAAAQSEAESAQSTASSAQQTASSAQQTANSANTKIDNLELTGTLSGDNLTLGIEVGS